MKKIIILLCTCLFFVSGCGQTKYIGKTTTYIDANSLSTVSLWYEVPEAWDCLDGLNSSKFIPNKDDEVCISFGNGDYEEILENMIDYNNESPEGQKWVYEELTVNGNRALKYAFHKQTSSNYRYFIDFGGKGTILMYADDIAYNKNPYEKEMDHIANTIKVI